MNRNRKTIGYIGGIPFMIDNDADESAFAAMFPKAEAFNGGNHPLGQIKARAGSFREGMDTVLGKKSFHYIPGLLLKSDFTFDKTSVGNNKEVLARNFADDNDDPEHESNSPIDLWITFLAFDFEADLERFLAGNTTAEYKKTIYEFLEDKSAVMPRQMICAYVKKTAFSSSPQPVFRFSKGLCLYINSLVTGSGTISLYERVDKWVASLNELGLKYDDFNYSFQQLEDAFEIALPLNIDTALNKLPKGTDSIEKKKQYKDNYNLLKSLAKDQNDPETENAIRVLCKLAVELDTDVLESYNQQADVRYDTAYPPRKLTANDFYHMARRLVSLSTKIKKFQNGDFKTADDVVDFVNAELVDPSALGMETKFVINYPFQKLSYQKRKEIIILFLDGKRTLSLSGFLRSLGHDMFNIKRVSAGDIVYNLITTGNKDDLAKIFYDFNDDGNLSLLISQSDDDLFNNIVLYLTDVATKTVSKDAVPAVFIECINNQNFFFFDSSNQKIQSAYVNPSSKKLSIENSGYFPKSKSSDNDDYDGFSSNTPKTDEEMEQERQDYQDQQNEYVATYSSQKKEFKPLELLVLTAESDINSRFLKLKKDDITIVPACLLYALIQEAHEKEINFMTSLSLFVLFLPINVLALTTALRAANLLGVVANASDIGVDLTLVVANNPEIQDESPEFTKAINNFAFFYGLARLGSVTSEAVIKKLANVHLLEALQNFAKEASEFIKNLPRVSQKFIEAIKEECRFYVLNKALVAFTNKGKLLFVMDPEGIILKMKIFTDAAPYEQIITEVKKAKIKVEKLGNKIFEEHIQLKKGFDKNGNPIIKLATPFVETKQRWAEIINQFFERSGDAPPCKNGLKVSDEYLSVGSKVVIYGDKNGIRLGNWGTLVVYKTEFEVRNYLSLLEDFKPSEKGIVARVYEIIEKVPVRKSIVGPLAETKGILAGKTTEGGAVQFDFLFQFGEVKDDKTAKFFKLLDEITIK